MKVAQFLAYFPPHKGWVETVAEEFSRNFVSEKQGEVLNIVFSVGQSNLDSYIQAGYQVLIIPAFDLIPNYPFPKFWKKKFRSVLSEVKSRNPDIIQTHTRFFLATFLGGICAKLWEIKRVHVEHGSGLVKWLSWRKSFFANLYDFTLGALIFRLSSAIVAISEANVAFIQRFTRKKVQVIYRGLDFPQVSKKTVENWNLKKNKKSDQISLVFIGRLVKLKGLDLLISAFSEIYQKYPNTHLSIIGSWEQEDSLKAQSKQLNLQNAVTFSGALSHDEIISEILPQTDIFINPSLQEGLPTTVIEALMAKTTVVATDVGWTREISSEQDLIIVNPNNKTSLKSWIEKAIQTFEAVSGLSETSVRKKFDRKQNVLSYTQLYNRLIKKK